jgi:hypothetical protein
LKGRKERDIKEEKITQLFWALASLFWRIGVADLFSTSKPL